MNRHARKNKDTKSLGLLFLLLTFGTAAIFVIDLWVPSGVAVPMLYPTGVLLTGWLPKPKHTLLIAASSSLLVLAGLFISLTDSARLVVITNHLLALATIWLTAGLILLHKQREEKVKHLTGLLPMCSSCKKIRDDKGFWSRVEQYFEEHHADLQFTHGLCPACSKQLYPDLFPRLSERHPEVYKEVR